MKLFQNRIFLTLAALLTLLVFSGDVLDDVWNIPGSTASSHPSPQHKGSAPKTASVSHDDTVAIGQSLGVPAPQVPLTVRYLVVDEDAPAGARPAIDHPPQLA